MKATAGTIRWVFVDEYDLPRLWWIMIGIVAAAVVLVTLLVVGIAKASYPGERAAYEQLRHDMQQVSGGSAEGIYRIAAEQNMELLSRQQCNRLWYCGWSVDDRWDSVAPLVIPRAEQ